MSDIHNQPNLVNTLEDKDRIAAGKPGIEGAKNIYYERLRDQIKGAILPNAAQGSILYRNATDWVVLLPGTTNQVLKTKGANENPVWEDESGGGGGQIESVLKDPFTETIEIANLLQHSPSYTQVAPLNLIKGATSVFIGGEYNTIVTTNGDSIAFDPATFVIFNNDYSNLVAGDYLFSFKLLPPNADSIESIGVVIKAYNLDVNPPTIDGFSGVGLNDYVDVEFNEGIYGANDGSAPVVLADLQITNFVAGVATSCFINAITKTDGNSLSGGETTIRCQLTFVGIPNGTESFEVQPNGASSIYDQTGNAMADTETTGTINTIDAPNLLIDQYDITGLTIPNSQTITISNEFTIFVMADTLDGVPSGLNALIGWDTNSNNHLRAPGVFRAKYNSSVLGDTSQVFNDGANAEKIFAFTYSLSNNLVETLVDDVNVFTSTPIASFVKTSVPFYWGGNIAGHDDWNGNIYAVRVYDKQLSPTQSTDVYNELNALRP